mgnify:CR=1 FL=1
MGLIQSADGASAKNVSAVSGENRLAEITTLPSDGNATFGSTMWIVQPEVLAVACPVCYRWAEENLP